MRFRRRQPFANGRYDDRKYIHSSHISKVSSSNDRYSPNLKHRQPPKTYSKNCDHSMPLNLTKSEDIFDISLPPASDRIQRSKNPLLGKNIRDDISGITKTTDFQIIDPDPDKDYRYGFNNDYDSTRQPRRHRDAYFAYCTDSITNDNTKDKTMVSRNKKANCSHGYNYDEKYLDERVVEFCCEGLPVDEETAVSDYASMLDTEDGLSRDTGYYYKDGNLNNNLSSNGENESVKVEEKLCRRKEWQRNSRSAPAKPTKPRIKKYSDFPSLGTKSFADFSLALNTIVDYGTKKIPASIRCGADSFDSHSQQCRSRRNALYVESRDDDTFRYPHCQQDSREETSTFATEADESTFVTSFEETSTFTTGADESTFFTSVDDESSFSLLKAEREHQDKKREQLDAQFCNMDDSVRNKMANTLRVHQSFKRSSDRFRRTRSLFSDNAAIENDVREESRNDVQVEQNVKHEKRKKFGKPFMPKRSGLFTSQKLKREGSDKRHSSLTCMKPKNCINKKSPKPKNKDSVKTQKIKNNNNNNYNDNNNSNTNNIIGKNTKQEVSSKIPAPLKNVRTRSTPARNKKESIIGDKRYQSMRRSRTSKAIF